MPAALTQLADRTALSAPPSADQPQSVEATEGAIENGALSKANVAQASPQHHKQEKEGFHALLVKHERRDAWWRR